MLECICLHELTDKRSVSKSNIFCYGCMFFSQVSKHNTQLSTIPQCGCVYKMICLD